MGDWSGEVAEMDIAVQSKELISHENADPKMLKTMDNQKWKNKIHEQKFIVT